MRAAAAPNVTTPPSGTVTFFFSDIEGSTRLLDALGPGYAAVLQRHRGAMRDAFATHGGVERGTEGDSFFVVFADAASAVAAAVDGTRALAALDREQTVPVRVRIGIHTGEGRLVDGDYVGMDVHRAARIAAAGHGGQVLVSASTRLLMGSTLPTGAALRDLGEHRLKDLPAPEHLFQVVIEGLPTDFPPLRSMAASVLNLPAAVSSIVGREADIVALEKLLDASRLVTVTGPGGIGKTRLVQEVARTVAAGHGPEVAFVPLQALSDPTLILVEVLRAFRLDIATERDPLERFAEHIGNRATLLVLDNLEQLAGAGLVVRSLLDRAPTLTILASSQAALHVAGEQEFALGTLWSPDGAEIAPNDPADVAGADAVVAAAASPAARLFVERAKAVRSDFAVDASNAAAVIAICARLDGLPLAIELAAAQVRFLSPAAILDRIVDRLDALTARRDDLPARHRTLRATVAWSYELLGEDERRLFRRLAIFVGGAGLAEVESIAAVVPGIPDWIGVLEGLVDRSLVSARLGRADSDRFGMLSTVRAYALEMLDECGERQVVSRRHAQIYRDLARRAEPEFYGRSRRVWLDRLAEDHDNLRAALDAFESDGDLESSLSLAADLWRFWQQRGHITEGLGRLRRLLDAAARPAAPPVSLVTLSWAEEATGSLGYWGADGRPEVRTMYERALEHAIQSGDLRRQAWARHSLAFVHDFTPSGGAEAADLERATGLRLAALAEFRALDDRRGIAESLWAMGAASMSIQLDPARARALLVEAMPMLEELGDLFSIAWAHNSLSLLDAVEGDLEAAQSHLLDAAAVARDDGDSSGQLIAVMGLGAIAARKGDDLAAIRHLAAGEAAARRIGVVLPRISPIIEPLEAAAARVAPDVLERERAIGIAVGASSLLTAALASRQGGAELDTSA